MKKNHEAEWTEDKIREIVEYQNCKQRADLTKK